MKYKILSIIAVIVFIMTRAEAPSLPAFSGAEGFVANTVAAAHL